MTIRAACPLCFNILDILVTGGCIHRDVEAVFELTARTPHLSTVRGTLPSAESTERDSIAVPVHIPPPPGVGVRTVLVGIPIGDGCVNDTGQDE